MQPQGSHGYDVVKPHELQKQCQFPLYQMNDVKLEQNWFFIILAVYLLRNLFLRMMSRIEITMISINTATASGTVILITKLSVSSATIEYENSSI